MPRAADVDPQQIPGTNFGFTATPVDRLMLATEYTLVTAVVDVSGTTKAFRPAMEGCLREIIGACHYSTRKDNLMLRVLLFGSQLYELHGFRLLTDCKKSDYDGCFNKYTGPDRTLLYDSVENSVLASLRYAEQLYDRDFCVNALNVVLTDGEDNESKANGRPRIKDAIGRCVKSEKLTSLVNVLVGVNAADPYFVKYLDSFKEETGFDRFIKIDDATEKSFAKVADFVSKSISAQSQNIQTGASQQIASLKF